MATTYGTFVFIGLPPPVQDGGTVTELIVVVNVVSARGKCKTLPRHPNCLIQPSADGENGYGGGFLGPIDSAEIVGWNQSWTHRKTLRNRRVLLPSGIPNRLDNQRVTRPKAKRQGALQLK